MKKRTIFKVDESDENVVFLAGRVIGVDRCDRDETGVRYVLL